MDAFEFGLIVGQKMAAAPGEEDPGARTRALVGTLRGQGVTSGHWSVGPGGATATRINSAAPTAPQSQAAAKPAPATKLVPGAVTKQVSRSAF